MRKNAKICKDQLGIVMCLASMRGLAVLQHDTSKLHPVDSREDFRDILSSEMQIIILDLPIITKNCEANQHKKEDTRTTNP